MPGATASGADASGGAGSSSNNSNSNAAPRHREHKQGNQDRAFTAEQAEAVLRIRRCRATAFYDILALESVRTSCSDADIKKAYRKQSLLTHPDKNGHEHAAEAFKMVSRAFGVLGDKDKRSQFDRFGTDPDSRFGGGGGGTGAGGFPGANPFAGFGARSGAGRGGPGGAGMWDDEMSPEEMFQRFFGGGGGFGPFAGGFDTGPQFFFNVGGGPGIRVHQFGGPRPRRRPREGEQQQQETSTLSTLLGLLPILLLFIFPLISSIFSGSGQPPTPGMYFDAPNPPYTAERTTPNLGVSYYVRPQDLQGLTAHKLAQLDKTAEISLIKKLRIDCEQELMHKQRLVEAAQGWFFQDPDKMQVARDFEMKSCKRLERLGVGR